MNASGALLFNAVLHEKFAQEVTEKGNAHGARDDAQRTLDDALYSESPSAI